MTVFEFVATVKKMRTAQKEYYRFKSPVALKKSISLEVQIDRILKDFETMLPPEDQVQQLDLFISNPNK